MSEEKRKVEVVGITTSGRQRTALADEPVDTWADVAYYWDKPIKKLREYSRLFRRQQWKKPTSMSGGEWFDVQQQKKQPIPSHIEQGLYRGQFGFFPGVLPVDKDGHLVTGELTVEKLMKIYYDKGIDDLPDPRHM